ncbi:MAG TPA: PQQ-binding-like beta-propeller repeat protein [Polyangia bacterium]|jgi:outer membrane protein assembly factor BamB
MTAPTMAGRILDPRRLPALLGLVLLLAAGCTTAAIRPPRADGVFKGRQVFTIAWRSELVTHEILDWKPQEFASPITDGQVIYVGASNGLFYAIEERRGRVLWRYKTGGVIDGRALYVPEQNSVYFGGGDGNLYALDAATGKLHWKYRPKGLVKRQPVHFAGRVYFMTDEDRVYALEAATGKWLWQYEREQPDAFTIHGNAGVALYAGRLYAGFSDGYLVALDQKSGEVAWSRSLAAVSDQYVDVDSTPTVHRGVLYASSYSGGLYAMSPRDGTVYWRFDVVGAGTVRVAGDQLYFAAPQLGLHVLDLKGRLVWRQGVGKGGTLTPPLIVGQYLVFAGSDGGLYIVDRENGSLLQYFSPGRGISSEPTLSGRDLVLLSNGGYLYRMRLR